MSVASMCRRCGAELRAEVKYCDICGERTQLATRFVGLAIRYELLAVALVTVLTIGFVYIYLRQ